MTSEQLRKIALLSLAAFLLAAVMISLPSLYYRKSTGSFEYVRKGENLLDKGNYAGAVKYYELAYKSSPENGIISSDLVYAYSAYSRALAGQKRYDEAIEYLVKAYNIIPGPSTIQNLAGSYCEKALDEAKNGLRQAAEDDYAQARAYASMSEGAARNIGMMLYNDAAGEFRSGSEDTALLCLKESSLICMDPKTFEFMGDIYYRRADLKRARYYWHEAYLLSAGDKAVLKKIRKAASELALSANEKRSDIPHFEIRYAEGLPMDKEFAARTLEKAYSDIGKDLGYFPDYKTKVFFYSKKDFTDAFHMPYFVKAFYDGSIKMPAPETRLDEQRLSRYLYHEYTHAIVSAKTNNNCPAWLSEGLAVWEEFKNEGMDTRTVTGSLKKAPEISFRFMEESFKTEGISENKALCYVLGYTLVDFLLDSWGMPALRGVLKRLADKQHIVNAIDDELLISESDFEKKWRGYVAKKFF